LVALAVPACEGQPPNTTNTDGRSVSGVQPIRQAVFGGTTVSSGQLGDSAISSQVLGGDTCSGTLLTDSWVLSAWHCHNFGPNIADITVFYGISPTCDYTNPLSDARCTARGAKCLFTDHGGQCGQKVTKVYGTGLSGNQVELWQLEAPIHAASNPQKYSIAQPVYFGAKSSLNNQSLTIVGEACGTGFWGQPFQAPFTVGTSSTWSYWVNSFGNV